MMNGLAKNDPWSQTLAMLDAVSSKLAAPIGSMGSINSIVGKRRSLAAMRGAANVVDMFQLNAHRDANAAVVKVVERLSDTTVLVSWRDPTACHYGEQTWTFGIARRRGLCALSGNPIWQGDSIYLPRTSRAEPPVNANEMMLDVAVRDSLS